MMGNETGVSCNKVRVRHNRNELSRVSKLAFTKTATFRKRNTELLNIQYSSEVDTFPRLVGDSHMIDPFPKSKKLGKHICFGFHVPNENV